MAQALDQHQCQQDEPREMTQGQSERQAEPATQPVQWAPSRDKSSSGSRFPMLCWITN